MSVEPQGKLQMDPLFLTWIQTQKRLKRIVLLTVQHHSPRGFKQQTFTTQSPEAGKRWPQCWQFSVSGEDFTSWFIDGHLLAVSTSGSRGEGVRLNLLPKNSNTIHESSALGPNQL